MRGSGFLALGAILFGASSGASAQELVQTFRSPGFGGNPFNADYLLGVATAQRPERAGQDGEELSETELFARQIQSRLLSSLSSGIVEAITGAQPGTSGEFTVGDQTITFERTLTEIRLVITNNQTGEVTEIVVPVLNLNSGQGALGLAQASGNPAAPSAAAAASAPSASSIFSPSPLQGPPLESGNLISNTSGK